MNTENLRQLVAVAETGNVSEAASRLGLTQPAVSLAVQRLEKELAVKLFDRRGGTFKLTPEGTLVVEHAREVLAAEKGLLDALEQTREQVSGSLRVASSTIPGEYVLPLVIGEFKQCYPAVEIHLDISDSGKVIEALRTGAAEVGFLGSRAGTAGMALEPICPDSLVMVAAPGHRLAGKRAVKAQRLADERFILREEGSGTRELMLAALEECGLPREKLQVAMELGSTGAVLSAVQSDAGLSLVSWWAARSLLQEKRLARVKVSGLSAERNFYMAAVDRRRLSAAGEALFAFMLEKKEWLAGYAGGFVQ